MGSPPDADRGPRLDSWKAIADHFGRDVRTVIRWEKERGLPVSRVPGGRGGTVFAYTRDLDRWLKGARVPAADPPVVRPKRPVVPAVLLASIVVLLIGGLSSGISSRHRPFVRVDAGEGVIRAFDDAGRLRWTWAVADLPRGAALDDRTARVADLDGDGRPEVLLALTLFNRARDYYGKLVVLDADGRVRWEQVLGDRYVFGASEFAPAWLPDAIEVYRADGRTRISVAFHHHVWWPAVIVTFDQEGQILSRFVHSGWIHDLRLSADGRYLLAAGVSNARGGAALIVLDAKHVVGTMPPSAESLTPSCAACPSGAPIAYFVVPWSDLARPSDAQRSVVSSMPGGAIVFQALQSLEPPIPDVIVTLSPDLEIVHRAPSDTFWQVHRVHEQKQLVDHSSADCPWQRSVPLNRWTPASGWQDVR